MLIKFKKCDDTAITPTKAYGKGNCWDLYASETTTINSYETTIVKTGLEFEIPEGYQIHVYNRSGNPVKKHLILSNSVGIIDTDYRGLVGVMFHSLPILKDGVLQNREVEIKKGEKIAQFKLVAILDDELQESITLSETSRGEGGFGSSGR